MAISVADNFSYQGGKPLDARMKYDSVANMVNVPAANLYDGCFAYVTAEQKYYSYDSANDTDPTLGKWREYSGGQTIQVDTMPTASVDELGNIYQYIGATDSTYTNGYFYRCVYENSAYSWVQHNVQPHDTPTQELTSAELAEVKAAFDPTGSSVGGLPILFNEGGIERQVGWYRYSNGTKKPVYEKVIQDTLPEATYGSGVPTFKNDIAIGASIDKVIYEGGYYGSGPSSETVNVLMPVPYIYMQTDGSVSAVSFRVFNNNHPTKANTISLMNNNNSWSNRTIYMIIRYTKTTDTPA